MEWKGIQEKRPKLAVSACLLGRQVRYDGGHCRNAIIGELSDHVDWVPVCPEVALGMGVPRETIRLVDRGGEIRLVGNRSGEDYTEPMQNLVKERAAWLLSQGIHGCILKKRSPTCGMERVPIYNEAGQRRKKGQGLFAKALFEAFSSLPVEEEGRLNDLKLREHFLERVYAYKRWLDFEQSSPKPADLVRFHTAHKYQLLAHNPTEYKVLGRMVARAGKECFDTVLAEYGRGFMRCLCHQVSPSKQTNVLQHLMGFLKDVLDSQDKRELTRLIEEYRGGRAALAIPLTLLNHHFRKHSHPWVRLQHFFKPYPGAFTMRQYLMK